MFTTPTKMSGKVQLSDWNGLDDYEKIAAKTFEEGLAAGLIDTPPTISLNIADGNIVLTLELSALGDGNQLGDEKRGPPSFDFSLKTILQETIDDFDEWEDDQNKSEIKNLIAQFQLLIAIISDIKGWQEHG